MRERTRLQEQIDRYLALERELSDATGLIELAEADGDAALIAEGEGGLKDLATRAKKAELEALLSGEADGNDAYLEVHAGAGGTESQDWALMLERMYSRWAADRRMKIEVVEETAGGSRRYQVGDASRQRLERLRLAEDGIGRAPPGAHLALRRQCAAAYELRKR